MVDLQPNYSRGDTALPSRAGAAVNLPAVRRVQARGQHFNVCEWGSGPTLLLLHGFPDSLAVWLEVAPRLAAAGYHVVAFDQRGYGDSDMPPGRAAYAIREIAADVPALLEVLGIDEPVTVIGHDWGAAIAWAVAMFHARQVRSIVAISVGHLQAYGRAGAAQKIGKGLYTLWFQLPGLTEAWLLRGGGLLRWMRRHAQAPAVLAAMNRPGRLTAALNWYRANLLSVLVQGWPRIGVPVLGIWSDGDDYLTETQMTDSARYVDAPFTYHRVEGCGHWVPLERPAWLAATIVDWLQTPRNTEQAG